MKFGIIGAMPEETQRLSQELKKVQYRKIANVEFLSGIYNQHEVILVQSGIGKVQAAMTTALLLQNYAPDVVLNTGSAGGIGVGISVGDVVVSTEVAYHDVDVTAFGYEIGQMATQPPRFEANQKWQDRIKMAAQKNDLAVHQGLIVTGDQFVAGDAKIAVIKKNFPDALAAEMEGAAIGQVAVQFKVPFVVIRAMSDSADHQAAESFDSFIIQAGQKSAEMILSLMANC